MHVVTKQVVLFMLIMMLSHLPQNSRFDKEKMRGGVALGAWQFFGVFGNS